MTIDEAKARKAEIRERELYGWGFVNSIPDQDFANACNGCGPESWPQERRAKFDKWLATFAAAFDVHDCRFTFGNDGSRERFDYANDELEKNCRLLADGKYAWYNPLRYFARNRAHLIGEACRMFGWDAWKAAHGRNSE